MALTSFCDDVRTSVRRTEELQKLSRQLKSNDIFQWTGSDGVDAETRKMKTVRTTLDADTINHMTDSEFLSLLTNLEQRNFTALNILYQRYVLWHVDDLTHDLIFEFK